jgi:SAM-dependent methyltransferase
MRSQSPSSIPNEVWQTSGSSEHMGGVRATQSLLKMCALNPGQRVLDIGCGTGYTLYLLVQEYEAQAVGIDLNMQMLRRTHRRATESSHPERAQLLNADGVRLPFSSDVFDCAIAESVLLHTDAEGLLEEAYRVLTPGGRFGINEMTYIKPPPGELINLLEKQLGIKANQPEGWEEIFERAGFRTIAAETMPFSLWEQLGSHIKEDGLRGYLASLRKGLSNSGLRSAFLNREMLMAARRFSKAVGYGLYVVEKPRG